MSHSHANGSLLVRIWDSDRRLVYAERVITRPKHRLLHEQYTITIPDSDLGIVPDGGSIDFQSLQPSGTP